MDNLYGVVYKMTLVDYGKFYIGSTKQDISRYWGSGKAWNEFIGSNNIKRNDKNIKKEILLTVYTNEKDLREAEEKEILKYCTIDKYGDIVVSHPDCMNINAYTDTCSIQKGNCNECGYPLSSHCHDPNCSKYKPRKESKPCDECNTIHGHKKSCSKYETPTPCPECNVVKGHTKECSHNTRKYQICPECSGEYGNHKANCSRYNMPDCPECKGKHGQHYDTCSKSLGKCPKCNYSLKSNKHAPWCPDYVDNRCPHCKSGSTHKIWCANNKSEKAKSVSFVCIECRGINGEHEKACSHYKKN